MDFEPNEEQRAIRDMARSFAEAELAPHAAEWDATSHFPIPTLRAAAALGLAGICVREESGGSGLGRIEAALVFEELAAGCTSTAAYLSIHNMVAWMVDRFGDDAQRRRWLPGLVGMDKLASYCLTEPGAGSDAASLRTTARLDGDAYVLDGGKAFISGGGVSDLYLVMARTGGQGAGGISALLVEKGTRGLGYGAPERKLGWKSQPTSMITFDGCRVPATNRLGEEGQGFKIAMRGLDGGRVNIAACSLGAARACLERSLAYVQERRQFGQKLADFQNTRFQLADMATELEAARLMVWRAATALDRDAADATVACAMAKRLATDLCFGIVDRALQLHGGYGYIQDYEIERFLRDARVHRILEGTNEIMRLIIARRLLAA
ncbi:MAG TPA: acyl-CoA dehydrogenase family protein [Geminicoccaceae bacterium]|nr:acyl-CoA dehydrogenase family protein [Geminicoccus sp.]HMU50152.1 acyl-CoA dehydrogenase family protein [Geminicoccaceae bacterium]